MTKIVSCILLFMCSLFAVGQNDTAYYNLFVGELEDTFNDVINYNNYYYILGTTSSYTNGQTDLIIIELDSNLNQLSSFVIGTENIEKGKSLHKINNSLYISGETNSWGNGGYDAYFVKVTSSGKIIWEKTKGSASWDEVISTEAYNNNLFALIKTNSNNSSIYQIIQLDTNGNTLNEIELISHDSIVYKSIAIDSSGFLFAAGEVSETSAFNFFIEKINLNDSCCSFFNIYNFKFDQKVDNIKIVNGNLFVLGESNFVSESENQDLYLAKVDLNGNFKWSNHFGSSTLGNEIGKDLVIINDSIYLLGNTNSYGSGKTDFYLLILDSNGVFLEGSTFGLLEDDLSKSLLKTKNSLLLFGNSYDYGIAYNDILIIKIDDLILNPPRKRVIYELNPNDILLNYEYEYVLKSNFDIIDVYGLNGQKINSVNSIENLKNLNGLYILVYKYKKSIVKVEKYFFNN